MTKHRKTRLKCILQVTSHSSPASANHACRLGFLSIYIIGFLYGWSLCSLIRNLESHRSGTKALYQTAFSTIHWRTVAASPWPTTRQGPGCPWQTPAAHALFGISTDSLHWAAGGLTRWGLSGKHHLLGCGRRYGEVNHHPPPQLPPGSHLLHHLWKWVSTRGRSR